MEKLQPKLRFPEFETKWDFRKIKEILTIGSGKDYKHLDEGNVPVFGTGGLMTMVNSFLHDGETVCIGRKGTIDKPMYFNGKIWTVDTLFYTHSFKESYPKFVFNLFQRVNWKQHNEAGGVPSLSKSTIENISLCLPSLPEQTKIASFLSAVDEKLNLLKDKKAAIEEYKKGMMQKIFSQELRFKDEKGKDFADWEEKSLGELMTIADKIKPLEIDVKKLLTVKLHLKGVLRNENTESLSIGSTNYFIRKKGQFIYGKQNLFNGAFAIIPEEFDNYLTSGDVPALNISTEKISSKFLYNYLSRKEFYSSLESIASGSGSKRIHENTLLELKISIPCLEEQTKIATFLSAIDEKIELVTQQIEDKQEYKKGLLQQMFC